MGNEWGLKPNWENLPKWKCRANKAQDILQNNHVGLFLMPAKPQFFAFAAVIFESYMTMFPSDLSMISFMFEELEEVCNKIFSTNTIYYAKV